MSKRIQFVIDDKVYEALEKLRTDTDATSFVDVFRNALKTYEWVIKQFRDGREVISKPVDEGEKHLHPVSVES